MAEKVEDNWRIKYRVHSKLLRISFSSLLFPLSLFSRWRKVRGLGGDGVLGIFMIGPPVFVENKIKQLGM